MQPLHHFSHCTILDVGNYPVYMLMSGVPDMPSNHWQSQGSSLKTQTCILLHAYVWKVLWCLADALGPCGQLDCFTLQVPYVQLQQDGPEIDLNGAILRTAGAVYASPQNLMMPTPVSPSTLPPFPLPPTHIHTLTHIHTHHGLLQSAVLKMESQLHQGVL